uniref:N-acetyltransferase domain-containing protein n=1 Tax=Lotharella oceanica TaxID=641309 RepID=A0A7S2TW00_9EUKA
MAADAGGFRAPAGMFRYFRTNIIPPGLHIRPAELLDIPHLREINERELKEQYRQCWWEQYILSDSELSQVIEDTRTKKILGYILAAIRLDCGEIISLAVDWRWQRRGLGGLLVQRCIEEMRHSHNRSKVMLYARTWTRPWVNRMYRKMGFVRASLLEKYYADGEDAEILECSIPDHYTFESPAASRPPPDAAALLDQNEFLH